MPKRFLPLMLAIAASMLIGHSAYAESPPENFTAIFDGKTLDGWHGDNPHSTAKVAPSELAAAIEKQQAEFKAHWTAENGDLINDGHGPYCTTDKSYGDYELLIDYKTVPKADSGIYLRGTPQVQIWDYTDPTKFKLNADKGSGGLWNNSAGAPGKDPTELADKPFGEWNSFRIIQVGARTSVWLNGKHVVDKAIMENYWDRKKPLPRSGKIHLQTHGGEIRWRNIYIREIGSDEANSYLASKASDGFKSIFNGKNFDGWQGAVENYEVDNGAIRCKKGKGGNLFTDEEYADFVVRLEFKLPPGGNNGLAIRYPGKGNPAYHGMTELQVLDSEHPKYAKLDKAGRQHHGSAYGMIPAERGYLRDIGQWNFQEVTVKGPTIKVELNGSVILDGDVSKVEEVMANSPHPGKDLTSGYFGFAGHNDPVEFRNISIKKL
jgi:hypothetical protein